ncbi:hypothetical protein ACVIHD_006384 [Bradyrhizobium embrapense]
MASGVVREERKSAREIGRSCLGKVFDFAGKPGVGLRFLAFWDFAFERFVTDGASSALGKAMSKPRDDRQKDLLLPALDQIIDMGQPAGAAATLIDWKFLDNRFWFGVPNRSGAAWPTDAAFGGLFILKHMDNLSDEVLCARWIENPSHGELGVKTRCTFLFDWSHLFVPTTCALGWRAQIKSRPARRDAAKRLGLDLIEHAIKLLWLGVSGLLLSSRSAKSNRSVSKFQSPTA